MKNIFNNFTTERVYAPVITVANGNYIRVAGKAKIRGAGANPCVQVIHVRSSGLAKG